MQTRSALVRYQVSELNPGTRQQGDRVRTRTATIEKRDRQLRVESSPSQPPLLPRHRHPARADATAASNSCAPCSASSGPMGYGRCSRTSLRELGQLGLRGAEAGCDRDLGHGVVSTRPYAQSPDYRARGSSTVASAPLEQFRQVGNGLQIGHADALICVVAMVYLYTRCARHTNVTGRFRQHAIQAQGGAHDHRRTGPHLEREYA